MKYLVYDPLRQPFEQTGRVLEAASSHSARIDYALDADLEPWEVAAIRLDLLSVQEKEKFGL
jgi:ABC-type uncharacterized transport system auxiliary subunit